jgi:hypothetical protein
MLIINGIILILMLLTIVIFSVDRFDDHKQMLIEIFKEPPNEACQGPILGECEYGRAQGEEGPGLAISGQVDPRKRGLHRRRMTAQDDQAQKFEGWPMAREREEQAATVPKGHLQHPHGQV